MSGTNPKTKSEVEALARRQRDGETLSKNDAFEVNEGVRVGLGNVKNIRDGIVN